MLSTRKHFQWKNSQETDCIEEEDVCYEWTPQCRPYMVPMIVVSVILVIVSSAALTVSAVERHRRKMRRRREEFSVKAGLRMHFQSLMGSRAGKRML